MHGIILAHGKAKEITELHKITWDRYLDSYEVISPEDDPAKIIHTKTNLSGLSEHCGYHTVERQRYAFELASKHPVSAIIEYDVILLGKLPVPNDMELFAAKRCEDGQTFVSKWYAHCPWVITQNTAELIASYKDKFYDATYGDRWLAAVCDDAGITHRTIPRSYSPHGGTVNNEREARLLERAAYNDSPICIHGNKIFKLSKRIITDLVL